jgi:dephospho-CoA kinase
MLVIGLTGGIATGKSSVVHMIPELPLIDCDQLARDIVVPGTRAYQLIVQRFGPSVCPVVGGPLDREALAKLVFTNKEHRQWINSVTHWRIALLIARHIVWYWVRGTKAVLLDSPLLFESGLQRVCSLVICVTVSPQTQLERLMARDHIGASLARSKINAQMSSASKCKRSQLVIDNEGTIAETQRRVNVVMQQALATRRSLLLSRSGVCVCCAVFMIVCVRVLFKSWL